MRDPAEGFEPPQPPPNPQPIARCYRHPMRETGVRCIRCDRPICPDCMRPASVGFQCPDDYKIGRASIRTARTSVGSTARAREPIISWGLIALNVVVYLITALPSPRGFNENHSSSLFNEWVLVPQWVASRDEYYRLITSAFLHYGLLHIVMNMVALALVGPYLERFIGHWRFAALYLLSALGGSAAVYAFDGRFIAVAGASGAIYGLFAACLILVRDLGFDLRWLGMTIALNFVITFSVPEVSKWGHIGGFVVGGLCTMAMAGVPWARRRMPIQVQAGGLFGLLVLIVVVVAWRSAVLA